MNEETPSALVAPLAASDLLYNFREGAGGASDVIFCLPSHNSHALSFCPPGVIGQMLRISSGLKGQRLPGDLLAVGFVNN